MIDFRLEIPELAALIRRFERGPEIVAEEMETATREAAEDVDLEVTGRTPRVTGRLQESIRVETRAVGGEFTATISTPVPYAPYVEFGTRPHVIEPRRRKALAFRMGGRRVVYRRVHHPGTRAVRMFQRGWEASQEPIRRRYANALRRVTRRLAGR